MKNLRMQNLGMSWALAAVLLVLSLAVPALANPNARLSGDEIRELIRSSRIYLATPLGGEMPMNYRAGGTVDASGEAIGLGRFFQPKDQGRWWIAGDRLCQKWQSWYSGVQICFTLERAGANRLIWRRDNGETGAARFTPN